MIEINETAFETEVIEASRRSAVLVDFWAPWCGPCRALGPILERLEQSYEGRFRLVKINSDDSPAIAARYGVRGIPNVIAFLDGEPVDQFVGALPEREVRAFIDRIVPNDAERRRREAARHLHEGRVEEAMVALREALALDPANAEARLDLAQLMLERLAQPAGAAELSEVEAMLAPLGKPRRDDARRQALELRLSSLRAAASAAPRESLLARIAAQPGDLEARFELAQGYIAARQLPEALEQLLAIVGRGRGDVREAARTQFLALLQLLGDSPDRVSEYRRRLSQQLH